MPLTLTAPPARPPVTLAEIKAHLKIDGAEEDGLLAHLVAAATRRIEFECALAMIDQQWSLLRDCWPRAGVLEIPIHPVRRVDSVKILTESGLVTAAPESYEVDTASRPARIRALAGFPPPAKRMNVVEVALSCGFGDDPAAVPADLRQAVMLLAAHWHECREGREDIPPAVRALIAPWRRVAL